MTAVIRLTLLPTCITTSLTAGQTNEALLFSKMNMGGAAGNRLIFKMINDTQSENNGQSNVTRRH